MAHPFGESPVSSSRRCSKTPITREPEPSELTDESASAVASTCSTPAGSENGSPAPCTEKTVFARSEEHTSELQSHSDLVCRLLLEKKKKKSQRWSLILDILQT